MEDAAPIKRTLFNYFMDVAKRCGRKFSMAKKCRWVIGCSMPSARRWCTPLRNVLNEPHRVAYTPAWQSVLISSASTARSGSFGSSTARLRRAPMCACNPMALKFDTVGIAAPGVELRIADGEVMVRGGC